MKINVKLINSDVEQFKEDASITLELDKKFLRYYSANVYQRLNEDLGTWKEEKGFVDVSVLKESIMGTQILRNEFGMYWLSVICSEEIGFMFKKHSEAKELRKAIESWLIEL